ncbi:hypothetical protein N44_01657 [Microcystis aeruginosa NIES-44]|jgi:hypothetical protein|uniref:Uncharacterized protein n=1 Tax=Microcystis aeruginosa NIES-44 TaxID=449439 RepID=A0A0A1VTE9_MICAE|nr:hypothetical protein N44_01657 [Microcystis aeruginosa NIES-44]
MQKLNILVLGSSSVTLGNTWLAPPATSPLAVRAGKKFFWVQEVCKMEC